MASQNTAHTAAATIAKIADDFLGVDNLNFHVNSHELHEMSSDQIKAALDAAFLAGRNSAFAEQTSA